MAFRKCANERVRNDVDQEADGVLVLRLRDIAFDRGAAPYHWGRYRGLAQVLKKPLLREHILTYLS